MTDLSPPAAFDPRSIPSTATIDHVSARDGWALRRLRWGAPDGAPRGSILFEGGRGDHFEKYLEAFERWRCAGWQVESVDWRGQGGSGRVSADPHVGDIADFGQWIDDLADHVAEWRTRTPGPHVLMAHSMGGHLLLRALAEGRVSPDAAVLVAPMLGFTAPYPNRVGVWIAKLMMAIGNPQRPAWRISEKPGTRIEARSKLLTHDARRYADEDYWHSAMPETLLGPGSWRWVEQAYRSFMVMGRPGVLERVRTPILILAAAKDKLVSIRAIRAAAARLLHAELHVYGPEAAHEILRELDAVRDDALARIDAFLDVAAPR